MDISIVGKVGFYILIGTVFLTVCFIIHLLLCLSALGKSIKAQGSEIININKSVEHINKQTTILKNDMEAKKAKKSQISTLLLALAFLKYFKGSEEKGLNRVKDGVLKTIKNELPNQLNKKNNLKTNLIRM